MAADRDRFSTATRLRAFGEQAAERVYRAQSRRLEPKPRRGRLTGRAAVLALVVCTLIVALAYPLRQYVQQRSDIADQRRLAEEAERRVEELRDEKARWQDDAYVRRQARERLRYLMPGETGYVLPADPDAEAAERSSADAARSRAGGATPAARPWYENLWDGVDRADAVPQAR
ncbi:septum formation initiator family protein [Streptomyces sp. NPDC127098]|uniref:FtsB family cell division protein n=1 Tax=Streptomyces sp. NPDC127098 TaxID=3347137 RepID=UPI003648CBD7